MTAAAIGSILIIIVAALTNKIIPDSRSKLVLLSHTRKCISIVVSVKDPSSNISSESHSCTVANEKKWCEH